MANSDFNTIQPVENLQNVAGLTPTGQQQERKRRQNPLRRGREPQETPPDKAKDEQTPGHDSDSHRIDYCA
jgi:hypothetical protein